MNDCKVFACAVRGCQSTIHLHHDIEARLRRTHETFYCPAGHENYFPGKTDEERRVAELEQRAERYRERWLEELDRVHDARLEVRKCPFECGFRVKRKQLLTSVRAELILHLVEEHGAQMPAPVEEKTEA